MFWCLVFNNNQCHILFFEHRCSPWWHWNKDKLTPNLNLLNKMAVPQCVLHKFDMNEVRITLVTMAIYCRWAQTKNRLERSQHWCTLKISWSIFLCGSRIRLQVALVSYHSTTKLKGWFANFQSKTSRKLDTILFILFILYRKNVPFWDHLKKNLPCY